MPEEQSTPVITIDWESFYSSEFSLSKITTQQYVLSEHFEVIGIGVKVNSDPVQWFSDTRGGIALWLTQFPWDDATVVAHNAIFDGAILEWIFDIHPKRYHCTMQASRPLYVPWIPNGRMSLAKVSEYLGLPPKGDEVVRALGMRRRDFNPQQLAAYARYCKTDTELSYMIYKDQVEQLPQMELDLIDATVKKYTRPKFILDRDILTQRLAQVRAEKEEVLARATLADNAVLMSNPQFAEALESLGVSPPMKVSPTTGKQTFAFAKNDPEFKDLLEHPDSRVQALVAARLKHKSTQEETRLVRFIGVESTDRPFAVPLLYYGAHTGRFSGLDKLNLQNLQRGGALRAALWAPPGYKVVAGDLSQIEARITATLAGQDVLINAFRADKDVYSMFATQAYGFEVNKVDHPTERFVGKTCILGLGYQVGAEKLKTTLKAGGVEVTFEEAKRYVNTYRTTYKKIRQLWYTADTMIQYMATGGTFELGPVKTIKEGILLPNGMRLNYPGLHRDVFGQWVYDYRGKPAYLYGGKLCIAAGTEVLTDRGWVPIEKVRMSDRVFDGVELVTHGGLLYNGVKQTTLIDGVRMTPDHEVLTDDGWQEASQLQRPDGPSIRYADRDPALSQQWQEVGVGLSLQMRDHYEEDGRRCEEGSEAGRDSQLRVYNQATAEQAKNSRDEQTPRVCSVAQYVRQVPTTHTPSVAQLRQTWDHSMQAMAAIVQEFLGGHGADVPAWAYAGPQKQQWQLPQAQLPLGAVQNTSQQQAQLLTRRYGSGPTTNRGAPINAGLSLEARAVYDITNCGPRQRFVVRGNEGPFIVHNCENIVQALARIVVSTAEVYLYRRGWLSSLQVHDELVYVIHTDLVEKFCKVLEAVLTRPVEWMPDLPVAAEVAYGNNYAEAK